MTVQVVVQTAYPRGAEREIELPGVGSGVAPAVIDVLQAKPVPLVHCKALAAVEHEGTLWPVGATAVREPSN